MILKATINGRELAFDTAKGIELTIPVKEGPDTVNAYYIPDATIQPFRGGDFVGSVELGGGCNCEDITFNAHGNGTHTECYGHISNDRVALHDCLKEFMFLAELVTVIPEEMHNGDKIVTAAQLKEARKGNTPAVIIRTLPNGDDKLVRRHSGTNPVYLEKEAAQWLNDTGVQHLLIDQPSVDREEDGGELAAHHAFWGYPQATRKNCTITELIYAPREVQDGEYMLNILAGAFDSDASPSRVVLYKFES